MKKKLETYRIVKNAEAHKYEKSLERIQYGEYVMKHSCWCNEREKAKRPRDTQNWQKHCKTSQPILHVLGRCFVVFGFSRSQYPTEQEN